MPRANRIAADFLREQMHTDGIKSSELSSVFTEEPPDLDTFLYDSSYLNHLRPTLPTVDSDGYAFELSPIQRDFLRSFEQIFFPELYIAMVEEFGPQWAPVPMKNMFAIAWGKGSSDPETPIYNRKYGTWTKLRDFKAGPVAAVDSTETGNVIEAVGTDSFKEGEGKMFTVTTSSGKRMKVWEGHRFMTWGREKFSGGGRVPFCRSGVPTWKRLWDLKVGDHIAVANTLPEPENIIELPDWEVEWVGLMLGDGCMTRRGDSPRSRCSLTIGYQSPIELTNAKNIVENQGILATVVDDGVKYAVYPSNGKNHHGKSNPFVELQERLGLAGCNAYTKHIPEEFFSLNNRQIALLVSRLIDTDGWVSIDNTVEVGFCTASEQLADDYINLLLRLGVIGSKTTKMVEYDGEKRPYFQVRVRAQHRAKKLLDQLTLLDKEPARIKALEWIESHNRSHKSVHGDVEWDRIVSIEYSGWGEYWTLSVDGPANYISNGGIIDHNSGKDTVVRLGFTRIASLLSHMKSPQGYFSMPGSDAIHMLNVAATAPQARRAFFDPMKKLFKTNKHMAEFFYGEDPAEGANQIRLKNDIYIISGNSLAESQEGLNLIAGVADEISAFKVAEEFRDKGGSRQHRGAEGIVNFLRSSASSRFSKNYKVVQISFPRFQNDAIEKALAQGKASINKYGNEKSTWYTSGPYATWEVKTTVTKADFQEHYDADPESAATMYECKPPKTMNAFIRDETAINEAFSEVIPNPVEVEYFWGLPSLMESEAAMPGKNLKEGWQVKFRFSDELQPIPGALYCLHGDLAIKGDRAGVAMSHVKEYQTFSGEGEDERPIVTNDFVFSFEADIRDADHPREVQIRWYRQLIWELIDRGFEIVLVTFDQFQSTDMTQTLNMYGIESGLLSLDRNDKVYQTFKDVILDRRLHSYRPDTLDGEDSLVMTEIKKLRRVGRKIDHLPGQSKDEADALAGSVFNAIQVGGEEDTDSWLDNGQPTELDMLMSSPSRPASQADSLFGRGAPLAGDNPFASGGHGGFGNPFAPENRY